MIIANSDCAHHRNNITGSAIAASKPIQPKIRDIMEQPQEIKGFMYNYKVSNKRSAVAMSNTTFV